MAQMGKSGSANELEGTSLAPLYPDTSWLALVPPCRYHVLHLLTAQHPVGLASRPHLHLAHQGSVDSPIIAPLLGFPGSPGH